MTKLPISLMPRMVNKAVNRQVITRTQAWNACVNGTVPAFLERGRWWFYEEDRAAILAAFGVSSEQRSAVAA